MRLSLPLFVIVTGLLVQTAAQNHKSLQRANSPTVRNKAAHCIPAPAASLPVVLNPQETEQWCWAASGQMIMNFVDPSAGITQCDEANKRLSRSDCCGGNRPNECVQPGWPEFEKYGFQVDLRRGALQWSELKEEISCRKRPFGFAWGWTGGAGHIMVAVGYSSGKDVIYNDPGPPNIGADHVAISYDYFVAGADHVHWRDYFNVRKK